MKKDVTHIPICRRSVEERLSRTLKMTLPYVLNSDFPALPLGHGDHAHVNYLACRGKVRPPSYPLIFFDPVETINHNSRYNTHICIYTQLFAP